MTGLLDEWLDRPGPGRELFVAAAVRERCAPTDMLRAWMESHPDASQDDLLEAMDATIDLQAIGVAALAADGGEAIALPQQTRLTILERAGGELARRQLDGGTAPTLLEKTFQTLLERKPVAIASASRQQLTALDEAVRWAHSVGAAQEVDPADIRKEMLSRDFLEAAGGEELNHFVGREGFLATLRLQWQLSPAQREAVLVEAPGGMGKSLAIARFIADMLAEPTGSASPDAVFLFDFERLDLQRGRVSTVLSELSRQAGRWWVPDQAEALAVQANELRTAGLEAVGDSARGSEANRNDGDAVDRLMAAFALPSERQARFILFVDTFEEVEAFNDDAARSVQEACALLRRAGADVMEIYASRHFLAPEALGILRAPSRLRLGRLTQREAMTYLRQEATQKGITLDKRTADMAQRKLNGWPLNLRLAVALMGQSADFDAEQWLDALDSSSERRQATLYDRVLKRIRDKVVGKLAKPGLLLRRLTAPIIAEVLAVPCGLDVSEAEARQVLEQARQVGQLFETFPSDPGAVWHRRDIRALMFDDLRHDIASDVATAIHRAAVDFYARGETPADRAEELYHRLQLGEAKEVLDERWQPEAGQMVKRSLDELPPQGAAWLRNRLGAASVAGATTETIPGHRRGSIPSELRLVARGRLQAGHADIDDVLQAAGVPPSVFSSLGDLYAESLVQRGRAEEVIAGADALRRSRAPVPRDVRAGVYACAAASLEGRRQWREAAGFWGAAQRAGRSLPPVERLAHKIGALRTGRHLDRQRGRAQRLTSAARLVMEIGHRLTEQRVAAREAAAELGKTMLRPGSQHLRVVLVDLIGELCQSDDAFVHAQADDARRQDIAVALEFGSGVTAQRQLNDLTTKSLYGGNPHFLNKLIDVMREEVDWSLVWAVRPRSEQLQA